MSAQPLIEVFTDFLKAHRHLNRLAKEKQDAVMKADMPKLEAILQKEELYTKVLKQLEEKRIAFTKQVIIKRGIKYENQTLAELLPLFKSEEQNKLMALQKELMQEIETLKEQNEINQALLVESLKFVNLSIDLLNPSRSFDTYVRPGEDDEDAKAYRRSLFDSKA